MEEIEYISDCVYSVHYSSCLGGLVLIGTSFDHDVQAVGRVNDEAKHGRTSSWSCELPKLLFKIASFEEENPHRLEQESQSCNIKSFIR